LPSSASLLLNRFSLQCTVMSPLCACATSHPLINKSGPDWSTLLMKDYYSYTTGILVWNIKVRHSDWKRIIHGLINSLSFERIAAGHTHTPTEMLIIVRDRAGPDQAYLAHRTLLFRLLGIFIWDFTSAQNVLVQKTHRSSEGGPGFGPQTPTGLNHHLLPLYQTRPGWSVNQPSRAK